MAVDADDLVVGATRSARLGLGLTCESLARPLPAASLFGDAASDHEDFLHAERTVLQRALARSDGNVSAAAQGLGVSRATLHRKLKRLGIARP